MIDRWLQTLGDSLKDESARTIFKRRAVKGLRTLFLLLTLLYAGGLVLLPLLWNWVGERNLTLAFLLYLPRTLFLLPLPFILLPTLFVSRRFAVIQLLAGGFFVFFSMGYQLRGNQEATFQTTPQENQLTVLTYNRGQHGGQSLQPFKNAVSPDLILLQDAARRAKGYKKAAGYEEFIAVRGVGEHVILSRYPIISTQPIPITVGHKERFPAARVEIDFHGRNIVIYSVHFLTPRDTLRYYMRGAFLYGIVGLLPGTPLHQRMVANQAFWDDRIARARLLKERIDAETLPTIVVGDFNTPSGGYIHRILTAGWQDSHPQAGSGFGFTFPGTTRNPLSLGGPWMRIDYVMAKQWNIRASMVERDRPSQHRALATRLTLVE